MAPGEATYGGEDIVMKSPRQKLEAGRRKAPMVLRGRGR